MSASIPDSVKTRKRYITLADLSAGLIIFSFPRSSGTCSPR